MLPERRESRSERHSKIVQTGRSTTQSPLLVLRTGRGWPKTQRGALRDASWRPTPHVVSAPHPSLRATFSPLCGEKGNVGALPAARGEGEWWRTPRSAERREMLVHSPLCGEKENGSALPAVRREGKCCCTPRSAERRRMVAHSPQCGEKGNVGAFPAMRREGKRRCIPFGAICISMAIKRSCLNARVAPAPPLPTKPVGFEIYFHRR